MNRLRGSSLRMFQEAERTKPKPAGAVPSRATPRACGTGA